MSNENQHTLILENRSEIRMTGVKDIGSFSDTKIILDTALGELTVRGEELHVIGLDPESGDFSMTGRVKSLMYSSFSSRDNIFRRLFR